MRTDFTYDEVPYPDLVFSQTHPNRMATVGKLLGMEPPPIDQCRVLELGCAGGANLLPMAYEFPQSTFVGIDLAHTHIEAAIANRDALGLENLHFYEMNILDIPADWGAFDYIIVHGIFSWVPKAVQEKILAICQDHLSPHGIAYISYNTYPGWHMLDIARGLMRFQTRGIDKPYARAAEGRAIIDFFAQIGHQMESDYHWAFYPAYHAFLNRQSSVAPQRRDSVLIHDALADINHPLYFYEFATWAERYGLQYVGDADFPSMMPGYFSAQVNHYIGEHAWNVIETEQYIDFVRNTTFRRTLLCRQEVELQREITPAKIQEFYISCFANYVAPPADSEFARTGTDVFTLADGTSFATQHELTKAAFHYLMSISPHATRFDNIVAAVESQWGISATPDDIEILAATLLQAYSYSTQFIELQIYSPDFVTTVSERPIAHVIARQFPRAKQVTNRRHEPVEVDNVAFHLLPYLDGEHTKADLLEILMALFEAGKLVVEYRGTPTTETGPAREALMDEIEQTLYSLAQRGVLIG